MESLEEILKRYTPTNSLKLTGNDNKDAVHDKEPSCEICQDTRWLRVDAQIGTPGFGTVEPCECQERVWGVRRGDLLRRYSNLGPLGRLTFDSMTGSGRGVSVDTDSFSKAIVLARQYAENPDGWLVILGPSGSGKTHLAAAVANRIIELDRPVLFIPVPDLLDHLRAAFDPNVGPIYDQIFIQVTQAPVLVLDDLGTLAATPWADAKLDQILTHRYNERLPTIVTSSGPASNLSERLQTRLFDPALAKVAEIRAGRVVDGADHAGVPTRMLNKMTFTSFETRGGSGASARQRETLKEAAKAARSFAGAPEAWLYLTGPTGTGKTHLAVAIVNERLQRGEPALFRFVPDLLDQLRRSFDPTSDDKYDRLFDQLLTTELLILDDLGAHASTPWAEEKLYQIIVRRHDMARPTVITSRILLEGLDDSGIDSSGAAIFSSRYAQAVASRLRDALIVVERLMDAPDFRHRGAEAPAQRRHTRRASRR